MSIRHMNEYKTEEGPVSHTLLCFFLFLGTVSIWAVRYYEESKRKTVYITSKY